MPLAACAVAAKHVETSGQLRRPDFFRRPQRGCTVASSHQPGLLFHDIWEPDKPRQVEGTASRCRLPCVWDASLDAAEFVSFGRHSTEGQGSGSASKRFRVPDAPGGAVSARAEAAWGGRVAPRSHPQG